MIYIMFVESFFVRRRSRVWCQSLIHIAFLENEFTNAPFPIYLRCKQGQKVLENSWIKNKKFVINIVKTIATTNTSSFRNENTVFLLTLNLYWVLSRNTAKPTETHSSYYFLDFLKMFSLLISQACIFLFSAV